MTKEEFIEKARKVHRDKYDYSKVELSKVKDKVVIICPKHGEFYPLASQFIHGGNDCPKCIIDSYRLGTEEFIRRAKEVHGDTYNYSKVVYKNIQSKVIITCPIHGDFEQIAANHLKGCGCAKENTLPSKGEELIAKFLDENNIKYYFQYDIITKKLARNSNLIRVDFALKKNNHIYIIEYNGKQHYEYIPFFHTGGIIDFERQQRRDNILREFCALYKDKITLIEIKYDMKEAEIKNLIGNILGI